MSRYLKEPSSVLKIIFQIVTYDKTTGEAIKNELKVAIPLEYFYKQPSRNENVQYTLVSLINRDGDSLDFGHYIGDVFDANTGICWQCDDDNITQISDVPKGVYIVESHKKIDVRINRRIFFVYIRTSHLKDTALFIFKNSQPCPKSIILRNYLKI